MLNRHSNFYFYLSPKHSVNVNPHTLENELKEFKEDILPLLEKHKEKKLLTTPLYGPAKYKKPLERVLINNLKMQVITDQPAPFFK